MHGEDERHTAPARARLVSAAVLVASGRRRLRLPRTSRRRQTARTNPIRAGTTVTQPRMGHLGRSLLPPGVELAVLDEASAIGVEARHGSLKLVAVELRAERLTKLGELDRGKGAAAVLVGGLEELPHLRLVLDMPCHLAELRLSVHAHHSLHEAHEHHVHAQHALETPRALRHEKAADEDVEVATAREDGEELGLLGEDRLELVLLDQLTGLIGELVLEQLVLELDRHNEGTEEHDVGLDHALKGVEEAAEHTEEAADHHQSAANQGEVLEGDRAVREPGLHVKKVLVMEEVGRLGASGVRHEASSFQIGHGQNCEGRVAS
mmetsp:Transcript_93005/g.265536  ORF Transcript_93005/g.265536 Transcript_93005/m.265536 type:complete len:322 (-) Transcript_93005:140-1105(-)